MVINIVASCPFTNNPPTSAFAADAMTLRNMLHTARRGPFIGDVSVGGKLGLFDGEIKY